jgi:hypothetical protein
MSQAVKDLLAAAAGPTGAGDQGWHAGRVDRLYFSDPKDVNAAGQVDVIDGPEAPTYVRIEAWVSPALAAQIVALVTGEAKSVEIRLRHELREELRPIIAAEVERDLKAEPVEPTEPEHKPPADDPRGFAARDTAAKADLARRDGERMRELTILAQQQADDEAADAAADEDTAASDADHEGDDDVAA